MNTVTNAINVNLLLCEEIWNWFQILKKELIMNTEEFKVDAITLSRYTKEKLEAVLQAKKNNDNVFFKNFAQNDIAKCCSIELVEYVLKHYEILATIPSNWFTSQQNVLQSLPE